MDQAFYSVDTPTWRQRIQRWLFPAKICPLPEAPADWKDCLHLNITCSLGLLDRIRLLLSGKLKVRSKIVTQNEVGGTKSESVCYPTMAD